MRERNLSKNDFLRIQLKYGHHAQKFIYSNNDIEYLKYKHDEIKERLQVATCNLNLIDT